MSLPAIAVSRLLTHRFAGEVTLLKSKLQFKPFIYLNLAGMPAPMPWELARSVGGFNVSAARHRQGK